MRYGIFVPLSIFVFLLGSQSSQCTSLLDIYAGIPSHSSKEMGGLSLLELFLEVSGQFLWYFHHLTQPVSVLVLLLPLIFDNSMLRLIRAAIRTNNEIYRYQNLS